MDLEKIRSHVGGTILRFSIPSIISMLMTSMITVADGFFIGNYVGKEGVAAVNLGLPIIYLFLAAGLMISVGGAAIAGMALGAGERKRCNDVFCQTIAEAIAAGTILSILVALCFTPMMKILHADRLVSRYFREYYEILLFELPVMTLNSLLGMFIRGEGNPWYFMKVNVFHVVLNIALDAVFSIWFGWGVGGIAASSLLAALTALFCNLYFFKKKANVYCFRRFTFSKKVLRSTLLNGSSELIGELSLGIAMFAYNFVIMRRIGADGVTAFTVVGYTAYMFNMILIGFGQGASPLVSFAYGAGEKTLAKSIRKRTNLYVLFAGIVVILIMTLTSEWYGALFVKNKAVISMIRSGIRIFVFSFLFSGVNTITSFYFTAIGKAKESALISSARGLVVLLVCIFVLPVLFGMTGVWLAAPVTESVTVLLTAYCIDTEAHGTHFAGSETAK